ncbi:MAG TPA: hypothetical protein VLR90_07385, partial [Blastocatellia bacterium]|nr:hypothetical protein [Blastocatellia bacterium]
AKPAQFTPDSQKIIFYNSALRVEEWSVAERKLTSARELFVRKRCFQTELSPDGKVMACLDSELNLNLFDVASGAQVFQKKSFYTPDVFGLFIRQLRAALSEGELDLDDFDWINMGFSPDAHYFAAGARSMNSFTGYASENAALAVDLTTRQTVSLRGPVKKLLSNGFTFLAPDKLTGLDREKPQKSPVVSFPTGEVLGDLPLGSAKFYAPTRGNYLIVRPIKEYKVGVMDLTTKKFFLANKLSALDLYDDVFVSERINGELGLYAATTREMRAKVVLPRNMLGRLRATALSKDLNWLAISERSRGAVWNLAKGERAYHVRGFRGGHFSDDGKLYADFPKFEQTERGVAQMELARPEASASYEIKDDRAEQIGQFVVITKPAKEDGEYDKNVILEVRDVRTFSPLWSKPFPKEAPEVYTNSQEQTMACLWPVASDAAKAEIKNDPALSKQLAAMKEKEGDYFLQALDARTGKPMGRLLIETGKGSFRISRVTITGDWVVILDTENRVLIYSLSSGEQKGKVFGSRAVVNQSGKLLCVENESGQLAIYDLTSMEKRDQFIFSSSVSLVRFSPEGKSLFVLTANQTAYVLDMSALIK